MDAINMCMQKYAVVVQVVLVCFAGVLLSIDSNRQLVDYDEATYAKVIVDTLDTGQMVDLHRFGNPWFEKPPLYMWLAMGSVTLFGEHEFAFRVPSILAAILCCWLVYAIIVVLTKDTLAAACGFLILLTSSPFFVYAREVRLDSAVIAAILASLYFFIKSWQEERYLVLVLPAIAIGFLFKSVIALLALPIILAYACVYKRWAFLRSRYFWWGALAAFIIWAPWHLVETLHFGYAFWDDYLGRQVVTRAVSTLTGTSSIGIYLSLIGAWYIPWNIVLCVGTAVLVFFVWEQKKMHADALVPIFLPLFIAVGIIVLFTIARTHLGPYILPAFPFFALSIALGFAAITAIPSYTKMTRIFIMIGVVMGLVACFRGASIKDTQVTPYSYDERAIGQIYRAHHMPQVPLYIFNWRATETLSYYGDTPASSLMPSAVRGQTLRAPFFMAIGSDAIPYLFDEKGNPRYPGTTLMYTGSHFSLIYGTQDFPLP